MHELGIVYEVIRIVDTFTREHQIKKVEKIVLEVGELSQVIPRFIEECYPAAVSETSYEQTKLELIEITAEGRCQACGEVYEVVKHQKNCPVCSNNTYQLVAGEEFLIKEIIAY